MEVVSVPTDKRRPFVSTFCVQLSVFFHKEFPVLRLMEFIHGLKKTKRKTKQKECFIPQSKLYAMPQP